MSSSNFPEKIFFFERQQSKIKNTTAVPKQWPRSPQLNNMKTIRAEFFVQMADNQWIMDIYKVAYFITMYK
jgi:hypothetical protein